MTISDPSSGGRPSILVFCRAYLVDDFRENVAPLRDEFDFHFLCDGSKPGTDDTRDGFYRRLKTGERFGQLNPGEREDVVSRCRLLRNLPRRKAEAYLDAMGLTLEEWFDRTGPEAVLCHMVDEYVTHLASLIATKRGVVFVGYAGSFFPDRIQLTQFGYGTAFDVREPDAEEVRTTMDTLLRPKFRQDYAQKLAYSRGRHAAMTARYFVKRAVFYLKGLYERDPDNVHYVITPYVVERRRLSDFPSLDLFDTTWREAAEKNQKLAVYLPLGFFPESTIDYWVPDRRILAYEEMTIAMCQSLSKTFTVLVKEHPHMLGARSPRFYEALRAIPGVINMPPLAFSSDALDASAAVVLGAGSGGIEAALRGKPIFSYCATSYWFASSGASLLALDDLENWPNLLAAGIAAFRPLDEAARRAMIAACLRSTTRKRGHGRRWPFVHVDDLRAALQKAVASRPAAIQAEGARIAAGARG